MNSSSLVHWKQAFMNARPPLYCVQQETSYRIENMGTCMVAKPADILWRGAFARLPPCLRACYLQERKVLAQKTFSVTWFPTPVLLMQNAKEFPQQPNEEQRNVISFFRTGTLRTFHRFFQRCPNFCEQSTSVDVVYARASKTMGRDPKWSRETNWLDKSDMTVFVN